MKATPLAMVMASALSLAACTTPSGPVEVTRFVAPDRVTELGSGPIFVESAPGGESDSLAPHDEKTTTTRTTTSTSPGERG